jgi:ribosome-binding ATPase YchF (GTP1/OBG family)
MKPILYVLNKKAGAKNLDETNDPRFTALLEYFKEHHSLYVIVDARIEEELNEFSGDEKKQMASELGVTSDGVNDLIVEAYKLLGLITFFTTGEDETRAWTIKAMSTAPMAGTAIHTDFHDKFIRAEVIACDTLLSAGSYASAREKGLVRTEGKEYIVQDGDVIEFKI